MISLKKHIFFQKRTTFTQLNRLLTIGFSLLIDSRKKVFEKYNVYRTHQNNDNEDFVYLFKKETFWKVTHLLNSPQNMTDYSRLFSCH